MPVVTIFTVPEDDEPPASLNDTGGSEELQGNVRDTSDKGGNPRGTTKEVVLSESKANAETLGEISSDDLLSDKYVGLVRALMKAMIPSLQSDSATVHRRYGRSKSNLAGTSEVVPTSATVSTLEGPGRTWWQIVIFTRCIKQFDGSFWKAGWNFI